MKRITIIFLGFISTIAGLKAQNVDDALRYSQVFYGGSARFMSMGGAFTALGADLSTLSQNPAGIGVFRSSEMSITPQLFHNNTDAAFNGMTSDYIDNFNLSQAGIVFNTYNNPRGVGLVSFNFGYSFNKTNNLYQNTRIQGISNTSSMADSWAGEANGWYHEELYDEAYNSYLAYETYVIDTLSYSDFDYGTVFSNYGDSPPSRYGQKLSRQIYTEGYTGEHAMSFGGNYSNKVYFGATFGISSLRYISHYEHLESTDLALDSKFKNFTYTDHFENTGTGYSFKLGTIIKPVETFRIGLAFQSPVWYYIDEYLFQTLSSNFTNGHYEAPGEPDPLRFEYSLVTPWRALVGVGIQIKKFALLSADYEYVDYSAAKFKETGDNYNYGPKNENIRNTLKSTSNFRLGGEFRLNKLYLRGGYGYYGKPFEQDEDNADLDYRSFSGGIGFREQNMSIDFAYTNYKNTQVSYLYPLDDTFTPAKVNLTSISNLFTLTLAYKFRY